MLPVELLRLLTSQTPTVAPEPTVVYDLTEMATWVEDKGKRGGLIAKNENGRILYGARARAALARTHTQVGKNALGGRKPGFAGVGPAQRRGKPKMTATSTKPKPLPERKPRAPRKPAAPKPGAVRNVSPQALKVDPERFQFKLNTDASGVTDELKQVRAWNPDFAGVLAVWRDPADGQDYVVNGHHRHELASRLGVDKIAVRHIKAGSAKEARAIGALVNMAEGRGTAVDAAKFLRDSGLGLDDLASKGISLKGKVAADAAALTALSDRQFNRLARGLMDEGKALAVARHLKDHGLQDQLFGLLEKRENEGKDLSPRVIEEMAREMAATPTRTKSEASLFGDTESEESLFVQRNELKAHVRNELAKEVGDFAAVASKRRAERVAGAGNTLNIDENKSRAADAEQAKATYDTLVNRKGAISDALNTAAEKYASAKTRRERDAAKEEAVKAVRQAIKQEADGGREGERAGGSGTTGQQPAGDKKADDAGRGAATPARLTPEKSAQVARAQKRYEERDSLPAAPGAGLFGGDDVRAREAFGKLPDGAEVAIVDGKRKGEVGRIRHEQSLDGSKRVVVQIGDDEHTTPVSHDSVEPLNDLHSWRTPLGASGKKQANLLDGADYTPQQQSEGQKAVSKVASEINALAQSGAASGKVRGHVVTPTGIGRYKVTIKGQTLEGDLRDVAGWIHAAGDAAEQQKPAQPSGEKRKIEYVRAPSGGATSEVDGKFYRGGQLMPVHGMYSGQEKKKGDGTTTQTPVQPNPNAKPRERQPAKPLTPGEIEDRKRQADRQSKWDEMRAGPLGRLKWMGETPNRKGAEGRISLKDWEQFAEEIGPEGVRSIISQLEPEYHAAVERTARPGDADWYKQELRRQAEQDMQSYRGSKKHHAKVPDSYYARQLLQSMMEEQNMPADADTVDNMHRLNSLLAAAAKQ